MPTADAVRSASPSTGNRPRSRMIADSGLPGGASTRQSPSSSGSTSCTWTTPGCLMRAAARASRTADDPSSPLRIGQLLQRHVTLQDLVPGQPHDAHAPAAEKRADPVATRDDPLGRGAGRIACCVGRRRHADKRIALRCPFEAREISAATARPGSTLHAAARSWIGSASTMRPIACWLMSSPT